MVDFKRTHHFEFHTLLTGSPQCHIILTHFFIYFCSMLSQT